MTDIEHPEGTIDLRGRIALVTGVSRCKGIGDAICEALLHEGATVFLTARDGGWARELAKGMVKAASGTTDGHVEGHALDVTKLASIATLQGAIGRKHGRLDVLINNAAGMSAFGGEAASADLDAARKVVDVMPFGSWALVEAMLPRVQESDHGRIVNVSSGASSHGDPMFGLGTDNSIGAGYGAAKAAPNALPHRLAHEETKREGSTVRINAVCAGFTATFEGEEGMGARPPAESANGVLWAARVPDDRPNGGLFRDGEPLSGGSCQRSAHAV